MYHFSKHNFIENKINLKVNYNKETHDDIMITDGENNINKKELAPLELTI